MYSTWPLAMNAYISCQVAFQSMSLAVTWRLPSAAAVNGMRMSMSRPLWCDLWGRKRPPRARLIPPITIDP